MTGSALTDSADPAGAAGPPDAPAGANRGLARWQAIVLASRGDGSTRRRASDAVRLVAGLLVVTLSTVLAWAGTHVEVRVDRILLGPPNGVVWLVSLVWFLGFVGVVALVAVVGVVTRDVPLLRDAAAAVVVGWLAAVLAGWLAGPTAGRSPQSVPPGASAGYPSLRIVLTAAVVFASLPYLSRALRRIVAVSVLLLAFAALVQGSAMPFAATASLGIGYVAAVVVRLAFGSPTGMPSIAAVLAALADLGIAATDIAPEPHQHWGVATFTGHEIAGADPPAIGPGPGDGHGPADGKDPTIAVSLYGRDASEAQVLAKAWRYVFFRDSGATLQLTRLQQVEHEAYLTLRAGQVGVPVPDVVAAGTAGASRDALLVTRGPDGVPLGTSPRAELGDDTLDSLLGVTVRLRGARIAHGAVSGESLVVDDRGRVGLRDFRLASSAAPGERLDMDLANALVAGSLVFGVPRTAAAAARVVPTDVLTGALLHLQPNALTPVSVREVRRQKGALDDLRRQCAAAAGITLPELAQIQRVRWASLILAVGTVIGMWALVGVFANVAKSASTLKGASWGWVVLVAFLALLPPVVLAWSLIASLFEGVPLGQAILLQESQTFTGMIGGAVASMAVTIRFFQRRGRDPAWATTTGVLASTASWIVKGVLFVVALPLAWGNFDFHHNDSGTGHAQLVNVILIVVVAVGVVVGVALAVPKLRSLAWSKVKPQLVRAAVPLRALAAEPRKLAALLAGNAGAQLITAMALGAALHAFGYRLSLASMIIIITVASMLGGVSPVPGGVGIVEAGMIAGFIAAGVPQDVAAATVFVQRLFTAYLPPLWGWLSLVVLRRRELV